MTDQPTPPPTAHAAVTRGLERALRDLGVDLVGCPPSVLSGHVIKELREVGLLRATSGPNKVRKSAIAALAAAFRVLRDGRLFGTLPRQRRAHGGHADRLRGES